MTDLVDMLRKIENLRPGDMIPEEWRPGDWWTPLSKMCGDAATEIENLRNVAQIRLELCISAGKTIERLQHALAQNINMGVPSAVLGTSTMPREVEIELKQTTAPEPWGSSYAMNPENWT
jgi:hypothetical protein